MERYASRQNRSSAATTAHGTLYYSKTFYFAWQTVDIDGVFPVNRRQYCLSMGKVYYLISILQTPREMTKLRHCCICGSTRQYGKKHKNSRNYFSFPNTNRKDKVSSYPLEKKLLETRLAAWKNVVGSSNYDKLNSLPGLICVCSDHFHSGKPASLYNSKDIDWMPSKNLDMLVSKHSVNCQDANVQSQDSCSVEDGNEVNYDPSIASAENDPLDVKAVLVPVHRSTSTTEVTDCFIDVTRPMVIIVDPELLFDPSFSENQSIAVQCALDDGSITVKQEIIDIEDVQCALGDGSISVKQEITDVEDAVQCALDEDNITIRQEITDIENLGGEVPMNIDPNLTTSLSSTLTAECGIQADFDELPLAIQLDKSTQTEMSSFPKSREIQKSK